MASTLDLWASVFDLRASKHSNIQHLEQLNIEYEWLIYDQSETMNKKVFTFLSKNATTVSIQNVKTSAILSVVLNTKYSMYILSEIHFLIYIHNYIYIIISSVV